MISKETIKKIDFNNIINSQEPGGSIRHLVLKAQDIKNKNDAFAAAAVVFYSRINKINVVDGKEKLKQNDQIVAWVNTCLAEPGSITDNLAVMLAGIYQWENKCTT